MSDTTVLVVSRNKEVECLSKKLEEVQEKFNNKWTSAEVCKFIKDTRDEHEMLMKELQVSTKHANTMCQLKCQVKEEGAQMDNLLQENECLLNSIKDATKNFENMKQNLLLQEKSVKKKQQELEKAKMWFEERLALKFKKISGGRLQLVFTCIDPNSPESPFYFCVKINADATYQISDCHPQVDKLQELEEKLNKTNNFRSFVITMRKQFRALV